MNILFVCTENKHRSKTAEILFKGLPSINARSAGTHARAMHVIDLEDVQWADVIMVMQRTHRVSILCKWPDLDLGSKVVVLDIPDDYSFNDPDLINILKDNPAIKFHLKSL